jgi:hypothetical protein
MEDTRMIESVRLENEISREYKECKEFEKHDKPSFQNMFWMEDEQEERRWATITTIFI